MDEPLWTDAHAPALDELPQPDVRDALGRAVEEPLDVLLYGPRGAGKTAAVRALAAAAHDDPDVDLVELNVADFFGRTKTEIRNDPRFSRFLQGEIPWVKQLGTERKSRLSKRYKSDWSKAEIVKYVIDEFASYRPSSGEYKTLLLDNIEAAREDLQQALRRAMERHHDTTQFALTTRQPSKLIPPIRSRCFPVPVRAPTVPETVTVLRDIADAEGVAYDDDGLEYIAGYAAGDLRKAVLGAQTTAADADEITMSAAYEVLGGVGVRDRVSGMLDAAEAGKFTDARKTLDDLLVDEGLSGAEVLEEVLAAARSRYSGDDLARLHRLAGEVDYDLATGINDRLHLGHLLAELGRT